MHAQSTNVKSAYKILKRRISKLLSDYFSILEQIKQSKLTPIIKNLMDELQKMLEHIKHDKIIICQSINIIDLHINYITNSQLRTGLDDMTIHEWYDFDLDSHVILIKSLKSYIESLAKIEEASNVGQHLKELDAALDIFVIDKYVARELLTSVEINRELSSNLKPTSNQHNYYHYRPNLKLIRYEIGKLAFESPLLNILLNLVTPAEQLVTIYNNRNDIADQLDIVKNDIIQVFLNGRYDKLYTQQALIALYQYNSSDISNLTTAIEKFISIIEQNDIEFQDNANKLGLFTHIEASLIAMKGLVKLVQHDFEVFRYNEAYNDRQHIYIYGNDKPLGFGILNTNYFSVRIPESLATRAFNHPEKLILISEDELKQLRGSKIRTRAMVDNSDYLKRGSEAILSYNTSITQDLHKRLDLNRDTVIYLVDKEALLYQKYSLLFKLTTRLLQNLINDSTFETSLNVFIKNMANSLSAVYYPAISIT